MSPSTPPSQFQFGGGSSHPPLAFRFGERQSPQLNATGSPSPSSPTQGGAAPPSAFQFGGAIPQPAANSTAARASAAPPVFRFGGAIPQPPATSAAARPLAAPPPSDRATTPDSGSNTAAGGSRHLSASPFTFRGLHNTTPLPSPRASPQPSDRSQPPTFFKFSVAKPSTANQTPPHSPARPEAAQSPPVSLSPSSTAPTVPVPLFTLPTRGLHQQLPSAIAHSRTVSDTSKLSAGSEGVDGESSSSPAYDVRDEQAPAHRFFTDGFQSSLQGGIDIAKKAAVVLEEERLSGAVDEDAQSPLNKLLEEAKKLSSFRGSDTRTIAVLGDSGEGKSSLINSLLHVPGVAKTGDIGSACTSVVTEYRQKPGDQAASFSVEVDYLSASEIETHVAELLWSYRQLYHPSIESDQTTAEDYVRYTRESAQAWSALEAAFRHKREFKEELLRDQSEGAQERVTTQLVQWSLEIDWPEGGVNGRWKATADTPEECCAKTERFMQDRYWPFTKIIRVYLNAQVLKTGVVLADLPGLQDTNLARVRATEDYLMKCNNIFIVAKISRAITDQSLKSSLFSVLARHVPLEWEDSGASSLKIAVVCTKSEDIDMKRARQEFCGPGKRIAQVLVDKLDRGIASAKAAGDRALKKELKRSLELLLIEARNSHVREGLQRAYATKAPDGHLDVFCVSNKNYDKYSRKGNSTLVVASGIPEVRRFCHSVTAEAQLREAQHFLRSALFSFLNSLEMWARSAVFSGPRGDGMEPRECAHVITSEINKTESIWDDEIRRLGKNFNDAFKEHILRFSDRQSVWDSAAAAKGREWYGWHWSQYNAWCRNNGNHSTPKRGHQDWNREIVWKMRSDLGFQWELVEDEVSDVFGPLLESVRGILCDLKSVLLRHSPPDFHASLADGIDARITDWEYKLSRAKEHFAREISLTRRYAEETNHNSFILNEMLPTYRSASNEHGTGMASRQRGIVQGRITGGTLFPGILFAMSARIERLVDVNEFDLLTMRKGMTGKIVADANIALASMNSTTRDNARAQRLLDDARRLKAEAEGVGRLVAEEEQG